MSKTNTTPLGQVIVKAIDRIQDQALDAPSVESLITLLVNIVEAKELPIARDNLAIVYQNYGAERPEFWVTATEVRQREVDELSGTLKKDKEPINDFPADHEYIKQVIKTGKLKYLRTNKACIEAKLPADYQSFLIVPMRLNKQKNKNIGAFILSSKIHEQAFSDELAFWMDTVSNRFAYFIRHNVRKRRNAASQAIQNHLLGQPFVRDCQLLDEFVQALQKWFEHDEIVILLKHPLQTNKFILACCRRGEDPHDNKLHSVADFRLEPVLKDEEIVKYFGSTLQRLKSEPIYLNTRTEIENEKIGLNCHSWLAAPMRLKNDVNLGYIILYNKTTEFAFDVDEDQFIDSLSDSIAMMLGNLRNERFQSTINKIKEFDLKGHKKKDIQALYALVESELKQLYGIQDLHIFQYMRQELGIKLINQPLEDKKIKPIPEQELLAIIHNNKTQKETHYKELIIQDDFFAAPMRVGRQSIGCLLFSAPHIGDFTAESIDIITDVLAETINNHERLWRYELLNSFGKSVSISKPRDEIDIIDIAVSTISKVMFTENLYIALYEQITSEISFPYALKDGKDWEGVKGSKRFFDKKGKKAKTEEIILTQEPILHYTHEESKNWYNEEGQNREEKAGNYLASWVGVPIFSEKGVIGVIAAYHPTLDYIYHKRDVFFLQNIAHQVSGLFRALELEKSSKREANLKKQVEIDEVSQKVTLEDVTQGISNHLNESLIPISAELEDSLDQINSSEKNIKNQITKELTITLNRLNKEIRSLLKNIKNITSIKKEIIDINKLIAEIINRIKIEYNLSQIELSHVSSEKSISSRQNKLLLYNSLYLLMKISCEATKKTNNRKIKVVISQKDNNFIFEIEYNETSEDYPYDFNNFILNTRNKKDFELWRAYNYINKSGGKLFFKKKAGSYSLFQVQLPRENKERLAYIIEEKNVWSNLFSRWLRNIDFDVEIVSNGKQATDLIHQSTKKPGIILIGLSINTNHENLQIVDLINFANQISPKPKIILATENIQSPDNYWKGVDLFLEKTTVDGEIINRKKFTSLLSNIVSV